jgi:protein involved in polysaccharide export with SLBB domain
MKSQNNRRAAATIALVVRGGTAVAMLAGVLCLFGGAASAAEYRLGPADQVQIKVVEFNPDTLLPTEWAILAGNYRVDGEGRIRMPIIGTVSASGLTLSELNAAIEERVRKLIGFETTSSRVVEGSAADTVLTATTEIVEYRPFYVSGNVKAPGAYPYRPDLTVLQAVSIAGGRPAPDGGGWYLERDAINVHGALRNLDVEQAALIARQARLRAELEDAEQIAFPVSPSRSSEPSPDGETLTEQVRAAETAIFERRRVEAKHQTDALLEQKALLESEVSSLLDQVQAQSVQAELVGKELGTVSSLVDKGLTTTARRLALDRTAAEIESKMLQLQTSVIQVRQDINRCERDLAALLDKRKSDIAAELRDVQGSLDELVEKRRTSMALLARLQEAGSFAISAQGEIRPMYSIVRKDDQGQSTEIVDVAETASVEPGDTIKVTVDTQDQSADLARMVEIR